MQPVTGEVTRDQAGERYAEVLCVGCMEPGIGTGRCPVCGWLEGTPLETPLYLSPRTMLNSQYLTGRVLGYGGYGITYIAWDLNLKMKVAIKEYMPRDLATRHPGSTSVVVFTGEKRNHFEFGLQEFNEEARAMARFREHPGIVQVINFFRQNDTGYIVMSYLDGLTLKEYLKQNGGRIPYDTAVRILMPVMDALREVHRAGLLHRDISPENVFVTTSSHVKLIDFGAARYALGEHSKSLDIILKPGYAPEEQYRTRGEQGKWTDVYALAATLYNTITGMVPPESLQRMQRDELIPPSSLGVSIPLAAEAALLKALAIAPQARFSDVESFQHALGVAPAAVERQAPDARAMGRGWRTFALILLVIGMASIIGWSTTAHHRRVTVHRLVAEKKTLADQVASLGSAKAEADLELKHARKTDRRLESNYADRQVSVAACSVTPAGQNGATLSGIFGFHSSDIRYVNFAITLRNNWVGKKALTGDLGVKYFDPDSTSLKLGEGSTDRYSIVKHVEAPDTLTVRSGWGNSSVSVYHPGLNRVEFWWNDGKIFETTFLVTE